MTQPPTQFPPDPNEDPGVTVLASARVEQIMWCGYVVACPGPGGVHSGEGCGLDGPWVLYEMQELWTRGSNAVAVCPRGHQVHHPLIYPGVPASFAQDGAPPPDWRPRYREEELLDPIFPDDPSGAIRFHRWGPSVRPPYNGSVYWMRDWPELLAAGQAAGMWDDPDPWPSV